MELTKSTRSTRFSAFLEKTNSQKDYINFINNSKILKDKIFDTCLSIGGGIGSFDTNINKFFKFEKYVVIEPDNDNIEKFKKLVGDDDRYVFNNISFENWLIDNKNEKYDLIVASHCIYYFQDRNKFINDCSDLLNENGMILLLVQSDKSINELHKKFNYNRSIKFICDQYEVIDILKENKLCYDSNIVESYIDVENMKPALIDFLLGKNGTEEEHIEIKKYMNTNYNSNKFHQNVAVFTISKS